MTARLIHGSAHNIPLPDKSIHSIMTSPPYWGLRVYDGDQAVEWPEVTYKPMRNLPAIVIPGCDPDCDHDWQDASRDSEGHADDGATNSGLQGGKATQMGRDYVGIDICEQYLEELAPARVGNVQTEFSF